jgi:hypothetical protein
MVYCSEADISAHNTEDSFLYSCFDALTLHPLMPAPIHKIAQTKHPTGHQFTRQADQKHKI